MSIKHLKNEIARQVMDINTNAAEYSAGVNEMKNTLAKPKVLCAALLTSFSFGYLSTRKRANINRVKKSNIMLSSLGSALSSSLFLLAGNLIKKQLRKTINNF